MQPRKVNDEGALELDISWADGISNEEWKIYRSAIHALRLARVHFMLGGGFAQAAFTGRWRYTKDMDFYVLPQERESAILALTTSEFSDYYSQVPYDRSWIYRGIKSTVIVDIIWSMANQRAQVDELWVERAERIEVRGEEMLVMPMEELLWCKLYVLQRDRCDWIDIINLIYAHETHMNWEHLIWRLGDDLPLLHGLLIVYGWLDPQRALMLPQALRDCLRLPKPEAGDSDWRARAKLLDSRAWHTAFKPPGARLEI